MLLIFHFLVSLVNCIGQPAMRRAGLAGSVPAMMLMQGDSASFVEAVAAVLTAVSSRRLE
jgi:hypothetical protein